MTCVCIVMATYHPNERLLRAQFDSIRAQTHTSWICIINDDCSGGETDRLIAKLVGDDARFRVFRNDQRLGVYHNFEKALERVPPECELVALSDQDDVWMPHKLERMAQEFRDRQVMLTHSDLSVIDEHDNLVAESCWKREHRAVANVGSVPLLLLRNVVTGCASMFRRALLDRALPFPPQDAVPAYYHDLWLALVAAATGKVTSIDEPLVRYRAHASNVLGPVDRALTKIWAKFFANRRRYLSRAYVDFVLERAGRDWEIRHELATALSQRVGGPNYFRDSLDFGIGPLLLAAQSLSRGNCSLTIGLRVALGKARRDFLAKKIR